MKKQQTMNNKIYKIYEKPVTDENTIFSIDWICSA